MADKTFVIPHWVIILSFYSSIVSTVIVLVCILLHLINYRKPYQQRLMIRIQLIIPLFALSCYCMLTNSESWFNKIVLEPVREIYEAFVIYTFFSLLSDMLGGERSIIIMTSGRKPVSHPGFLKYLLPDLDISDSATFLTVKRGILQYVWLKPFICFGTILTEVMGVYDVNNMSAESIYLWLTVLYNISVSVSLYCLAIFWKILWNDLKPFNPVGKFLCVKLIIFASYWQGVLLALLSYFNVLPGSSDTSKANSNIGTSIQNALLCVELIGFAIGHWISFSYWPFTLSQIPNSRLRVWYAIRDMFGIKDLIHDFKVTFYGDSYKDYKTFDSVNALMQHSSKTRMRKINQGLRYRYDGKQKHWLPLSFDNKSIVENANIGDGTLYAPSIRSNGTSTKALATSSPKNIQSPSSSPELDPVESGMGAFPITEGLNNEEFNYDDEFLDEDEAYYHEAYSMINKYRINQAGVKKLINYPVVDNVVDSHLYGYKVKKLRESRRSSSERGRSLRRTSITSYGSIV